MSSSRAGFKWQPPTPAPGEMAGSALSFLNSHHRSCVLVLVINRTAHVNPQATCDRLRMNRDVCKHRYSRWLRIKMAGFTNLRCKFKPYSLTLSLNLKLSPFPLLHMCVFISIYACTYSCLHYHHHTQTAQ